MYTDNILYNLAESRYIDLGLCVTNKGFKYLCEATVLEYMYTYMSKIPVMSLYGSVADKFNSSYVNVERSIRYAISAAIKKDSEKFLCVFGKMNSSRYTGVPEAMILICTVARDIAVETHRGF